PLIVTHLQSPVYCLVTLSDDGVLDLIYSQLQFLEKRPCLLAITHPVSILDSADNLAAPLDLAQAALDNFKLLTQCLVVCNRIQQIALRLRSRMSKPGLL